MCLRFWRFQGLKTRLIGFEERFNRFVCVRGFGDSQDLKMRFTGSNRAFGVGVRGFEDSQDSKMKFIEFEEAFGVGRSSIQGICVYVPGFGDSQV